MTHIEIPLSDPDISPAELEAVSAVLKSPRLSQGPMVEQFEQAFATYLGRRHAVAVASGTLGLLLTLRAYGIGAGHEVVTSAYSWHQIGHAIALASAKPVFADIDYWSGTLAPDKAAARIGANTHALLAANINGHPAAWAPLRELADKHGLLLIEDSSEAIGSRYQDKPVGSFGDCAIFDFSQPGALVCGEGGMVVTDNANIAARLRNSRNRRIDERFSVVAGATLRTLSHGLGHAAVVRAMPNTPAQIRRGIAVWAASPACTAGQRDLARAVLAALGEEKEVADEEFVAMATALSGTGPTYLFAVMEALVDAGVHMGFPRELAHDLVVVTLVGSSEFAARSQLHPAQLRNLVTSPGGTSAAAIYELEKGRLRTVLSDAVWAAYRRTQELGARLEAETGAGGPADGPAGGATHEGGR